MKSIAVLTPSFRPDYDRLVQLHRSVLEYAPETATHHVIVPRRDLPLFRGLRSSRLRLWTEADFLPAGFLATDGFAAVVKKIPFLPPMLRFSALNTRRPWPPIRGWVLQQILKLSASSRLGADAIVIIDSDVSLLRPMPAELFFRDHTVRLYEKPGAITADMERHVVWTRTAHKLLGLGAPETATHPDYVAGIVSWDPGLVSDCLARIEAVTGRHWATAISSHLHFSEFILYGTYVRHFGTPQQRSFMEASPLCHSYWESAPLAGRRVEEFIDGFGASDIAVHIQSNTTTSEDTARRVLGALRLETKR